ncbi:hypothetical protein HY086_04305 [Candidatus Gottesmanbacteria bacterium]|nr:hypothetical protein [Candidatus Gottesmanbacteria bacterium]
MTATAHALVAGAIASRFTDPVTAGTLALVSHYVMDSIPHWDIGTNWRSRRRAATGLLAIGETGLAITLAYFLFSSNAPPFTLAVAVAASLLPDWAETPWYIFFAKQNKHEPTKRAGLMEQIAFAFYKTQNVFHSKTQFPLGVLTQVATVLFFLIILK